MKRATPGLMGEPPAATCNKCSLSWASGVLFSK